MAPIPCVRQLAQLFKTEHLKEHFEQLDALLAQKERDNKLDAMRPAAPVSIDAF